MATAGRLGIAYMAACLACALLCPITLAQTVQQNNAAVIGQITGDDVSISGQSLATPASSTHSFLFAAGSTIVVHSGQARVDFTGGGELDVCGPAKFTVLASGEALTIAVSFGRVRARFDPSRPVTIYTPLITAMPLAVMSQPRDITFGLEPNTGAMCVLAAHGAVQVQQQLSGGALVVPEPSEVLLTTSPLGGTPIPAGSCRCDFDEENAKAAPIEHILTQETVPVGATTGSAANLDASPRRPSPPTSASEAVAVENMKPTEQPKPVPGSPASNNDSTAPRPTLPPANGPIVKIVAPPLVYNAKSPEAPAETASVATLILAKEAVVVPEWVFHGYVVEPTKAVQEPLEQGTRAKSGQQPRKRRGFWAWFHRFLFGRSAKSS